MTKRTNELAALETAAPVVSRALLVLVVVLLGLVLITGGGPPLS